MKKQRKKKNNAQNADKEIKVNTHFYIIWKQSILYNALFVCVCVLVDIQTKAHRLRCAITISKLHLLLFFFASSIGHFMESSLFSWEKSKLNSNLFGMISSTISTLLTLLGDLPLHLYNVCWME